MFLTSGVMSGIVKQAIYNAYLYLMTYAVALQNISQQKTYIHHPRLIVNESIHAISQNELFGVFCSLFL